MTVMLTTHYIEEVRDADVVAFMRAGRVLAEDQPSVLMKRYSSDNLEQVFLELCQLKSEKQIHFCSDRGQSEGSKFTDITVVIGESKKCFESQITRDKSCEEDFRDESKHLLINKRHHFFGKCSALLHKNFKRLTGNWAQLIFFIILPTIQLTLLLLSISDGPRGLSLAVFNEEVVNNITSQDWGQLFISCIDNQTFDLKYFEDKAEAENSVRNGDNYAMIAINERFSKALKLRHIYGTEADSQTIAESQVECAIDWSNQAIGLQIERNLYEAMQRFAEEVAKQSEIDPESASLPLRFGDPVHGSRDQSMRDFAIPGCYILLSFFSTASVTAHLILDERRDGLMERSLVAGVTPFQFLLSHALTQMLVLCLQIFLMLAIPSLAFGLSIGGSLPLVIALALSQGLCGIAFGLMVSALCSDIIYAAMFTLFVFFVTITVGGVFWPIENMPLVLRHCSRCLPSSLSIESMRAILYREWSAHHSQVYIGFIASYLWLAFFIGIALNALKKSL